MKYRLGFAAAILVAGAVAAGPIKTWISGEYITASDLNAALQHLHANLGHGHGSVITNADISASANISASKISGMTTALQPKGWADMAAACTVNGACTVADNYAIASITRVAAGTYQVAFTARANANFAPMLSSHTNNTPCVGVGSSSSLVTVYCSAVATGLLTDATFSFLLMDSDI